MGLSKDDLLAAIEKIRKDTGPPKHTVNLGIPPARSLRDDTFRRVGQLDDWAVARMAYTGIQYALGGNPMHPQHACAIRVAYARCGSSGPEQVYNRDLTRWIADRLVEDDG